MKTYVKAIIGDNKYTIYELSHDYSMVRMVWRNVDSPYNKWVPSNLTPEGLDDGAWDIVFDYEVITEDETFLEMI